MTCCKCWSYIHLQLGHDVHRSKCYHTAHLIKYISSSLPFKSHLITWSSGPPQTFPPIPTECPSPSVSAIHTSQHTFQSHVITLITVISIVPMSSEVDTFSKLKQRCEGEKLDFRSCILETATQMHLFVRYLLLKTAGRIYSQMTLLSKGISTST